MNTAMAGKPLPRGQRFSRASLAVAHYTALIQDPAATQLLVIAHPGLASDKVPVHVPVNKVSATVQQVLLVVFNPLKCEAVCWGYIGRDFLVRRPCANGQYSVWHSNCQSAPLIDLAAPVVSEHSSTSTSPAASPRAVPVQLPPVHSSFDFNAHTPQTQDPDVTLHQIEQALQRRFFLYQKGNEHLDLLDTQAAVQWDNLSYWCVLAGLFDPWVYIYDRAAFNARKELWQQHETQLIRNRLRRLAAEDVLWLLPKPWKRVNLNELTNDLRNQLSHLLNNEKTLTYVLSGPFEQAMHALRSRQIYLQAGQAYVKPNEALHVVEPEVLRILSCNLEFTQKAANQHFGQPVSRVPSIRGLVANFWKRIDQMHHLVSTMPEGLAAISDIVKVAPPCVGPLVAKAYHGRTRGSHLKNDDRLLFGDFLLKCQASPQAIATSWLPKMRLVYAPSEFLIASKRLPETLKWLQTRMRNAPAVGISCNTMKYLKTCPHGKGATPVACGRQCATRKAQSKPGGSKETKLQPVHSPVEYVQIMLTP